MIESNTELGDGDADAGKEEHAGIQKNKNLLSIAMPALAIFVLVLCTCYCCCSSSGGILRRGKKIIYCVGDSITEGNQEHTMCYPSILRAMLNPNKF